MKKVKNEQIANKLVDAIGLLKALKSRKKEEIIMIDIFLKEVSDMLQDEKKAPSTAINPGTSLMGTEGMSSIQKGTATKLIAGKSPGDMMIELKKAMLNKAIADFKTGRIHDEIIDSEPIKVPFDPGISTGGGGIKVDSGGASKVWCSACGEYHENTLTH